MYLSLKQEVALGQRQYAGRLAGQQLTVGPNLVGLGIDLDVRQRPIVDQVCFAYLPAVVDRRQPLLQPELPGQTVVVRRAGDKAERQAGRGATKMAEHGPTEDRLALGSPTAAQTMKPPFRMSSGLTPKNLGSHNTRSASLPTSIEPTWSAMPWVRAGLMVYLAR